MYEMTVRVRFSDIGKNGKLRLYELPKIFQDCSIEHSEFVGVGIPYLSPQHLAWLLTSWQIDILRLPEYDERLTIQTWPYEFKSAFGYRNYRILDESETNIVNAQALWLHTDTEQMKPVRVPDEEGLSYGIEPKLDMEYMPRKILLPENMEVADQIPVASHYADMYRHLNNAMYVDLASDYLPPDADVKRIRVDYRKQLRVGDDAVIKKKVEKNRCYIAFYDTQDDMHVSTEFTFS